MRALLATCALLAATNAAWPADSTPTPATQPAAPAPAANPLPPPPPAALLYSWAGFYMYGNADWTSGTGAGAKGLEGRLSAPANAGNLNSTIASHQVSANWQSGTTVFGLEGDMQWVDQTAGTITTCGLGCSLNDRVKVPYLATLRARAGTAFDRLFVYGTGGFASVGAADNLNAGGLGSTPDFVDFSSGNMNWTVGGGMELALDQNMSAKIEYLRLQNNSAVDMPGTLFEAPGVDARSTILRGGINYRLPIGQ